MITRHSAARAARALLGSADQLHPAALLALVLAFAGLAQLAAPLVVTLLTALVTGAKAAAFLAGAAVLARLAVRVAATFPRPRTAPPAPPAAPVPPAVPSVPTPRTAR
ncbi:hypothetical protein [Streptomyces candidus]|uniref:Uncharacterized protein n=1 Tax=Streptomyces candidus TaxID=67283 RepID=A0A7X0HLK6_9ACTN|nr:hypothetical protein [Streptomyces candidus]MBB6439952.1 hypothetical protein [Streptomyces candidus]GHH56131.1 hypothetical protein GCM10018773_61540 [Streptomyces candidus]